MGLADAKTREKAMQGASSPAKIDPLTSARFFAAIFVVLYHFYPLLGGGSTRPSWLAGFLSYGYLSVGFFFMLSGFILALVYLAKEHPVDRRKFYISRVARVLPLYLASLAIDIPHFVHTQLHLNHQAGPRVTTTIVLSTVLLQAWFPSFRGLNIPSWSLSVEAFFYLLFPFIGQRIWRLGIQSTLWTSAGVYSLLCVLELWLASHPAFQDKYFPLYHLTSFLLGILTGRIYGWLRRDSLRRDRLRAAGRWLVVGALLASILAIKALQLPELALQHGLLAPLFGVIILGLASEDELVIALLQRRSLVVLGEASFALYLIHFPLGSLARRWIEQYGTPAFLLYVAIAVGLSVLSLNWLEMPARRWILERERVRSLETLKSSSIS